MRRKTNLLRTLLYAGLLTLVTVSSGPLLAGERTVTVATPAQPTTAGIAPSGPTGTAPTKPEAVTTLAPTKNYSHASGSERLVETGGKSWAIWTNNEDMTIQTADLTTTPPTVYGPFLAGQLGNPNPGGLGLTEVALTPDGHYALVSSFDDETVYRIDISDPRAPVLAGSVALQMPAEDIAVASNGAFALVTGGGGENTISSLDLTTFTLSTTYTLTTPGAAAQAVAIAPDNQTAVVADFANNRIIFGIFDPSSGFEAENALGTGKVPLNMAISPDGRTLLVANRYGTVSVFQISAPGNLAKTGSISGLPQSVAAITFSPNGSRAYILSVAVPNASLSWLGVTGPGGVSLGGAGVATLQRVRADRVYWGVDQLATTADGNYVVAGDAPDTDSTLAAVVSTSDFAVTFVDSGCTRPTGVACLVLKDLACSSSSDVASGFSPLAVQFQGTASGGQPPYTYEWNFGDGASSSEQNPTHSYAQGGTFTAELTVTDSSGSSVSAEPLAITVTPSPVVTSMQKAGNPFRFLVTGTNLQNGIQVYIGGDTAPWPTVTWASTTSLTIGGGKTLKRKVPKNTSTQFRFVNPDGGETNVTWSWP